MFTYAGAGIRKIESESFPTAEVGLKISKYVTKQTRVNLQYQCNQDFGDSSYRYCWGGASMNVEF